LHALRREKKEKRNRRRREGGDPPLSSKKGRVDEERRREKNGAAQQRESLRLAKEARSRRARRRGKVIKRQKRTNHLCVSVSLQEEKKGKGTRWGKRGNTCGKKRRKAFGCKEGDRRTFSCCQE